MHFQSLFKGVLFWILEYSSSENDVVISYLFLLRPPARRSLFTLTHFDIKTGLFIQQERMASMSIHKNDFFFVPHLIEGKNSVTVDRGLLFYQDQVVLSMSLQYSSCC